MMMIMTMTIIIIPSQIVNPINPTSTTSTTPYQNIDRGNNPPDRGQNNIMAQVLTALAAALGNLQPAPAQASREQNIAQVLKFHGYENKDPSEWAKRFDAACLTNNWRPNKQKDIAESFLDGSVFQ